MELPRGTFRSIRKGMQLGDILDELASSRFTGISTFSSDVINGALVFKSGECLLAKVQNLYGNPAWEVVTAQRNQVADVALSDLDGTQLQLALDFNKKARVTLQRTAGPRQAGRQTAQAARPQHEHARKDAHRRTTEKDRDFIKTGPAAPAVPQKAPEPAEETRVKSAPPADRGKPVSGESGPTPAEADLDTFDSMDLDDVAQKIRKDCKIILKQLQLDHLTEK